MASPIYGRLLQIVKLLGSIKKSILSPAKRPLKEGTVAWTPPLNEACGLG